MVWAKDESTLIFCEAQASHKGGSAPIVCTRIAGMAPQPRQTRQKEAIRTAFTAADRPLSHDEALTLAQQQVGGLSIATVYRNINLLVEEKWLARVAVPGDTTRYEVAGKEHHHHFQCSGCGRMFELEGCEIQMTPTLPEGFRLTGHEFFIYGLCSAC